MYPPVNCKLDFVRRYAVGEFGNHSPTWDTLEEYLDSGYSGLVHIRNRVVGGPTYYNLSRIGVQATFKYVPYNVIKWYISAMAPTELTLFQGEVMQGIWGKDLTYTTIAKPMRDALQKQTKVVKGIIASSLLRHFLCPNSYDWLEVLLDRYPDHVVEFSTYSTEWGTLPGFNTVFWEVRNY